MSDTRPTYDDEIDLFELFETLWQGKWVISAFVSVAILLGGSFILLKEAEYESKLTYSIETIPPFYEEEKVFADFQRNFYSRSIFEVWKKSNSSTSLVFEDFDATEVVDGFVLAKREDEMLATVTSEIASDSFVLVRANSLQVLDDFFKYANHINDLLKNEYVVRANEEIEIIETRFSDLSSADSTVVETLLSIDRYIASSDKGVKALSIQRPTLPRKVAPKTSLVLALSLVLGGFAGCAFVLLRKVIRDRKERLASA